MGVADEPATPGESMMLELLPALVILFAVAALLKWIEAGMDSEGVEGPDQRLVAEPRSGGETRSPHESSSATPIAETRSEEPGPITEAADRATTSEAGEIRCPRDGDGFYACRALGVWVKMPCRTCPDRRKRSGLGNTKDMPPAGSA